jgi:hypothetical protein
MTVPECSLKEVLVGSKTEVCPVFAPPNSRPRTGFIDLWAKRMKGEFDLARALVLVAFLPGDLDRGKPGLRSVDEIHADCG